MFLEYVSTAVPLATAPVVWVGAVVPSVPLVVTSYTLSPK